MYHSWNKHPWIQWVKAGLSLSESDMMEGQLERILSVSVGWLTLCTLCTVNVTVMFNDPWILPSKLKVISQRRSKSNSRNGLKTDKKWPYRISAASGSCFFLDKWGVNMAQSITELLITIHQHTKKETQIFANMRGSIFLIWACVPFQNVNRPESCVFRTRSRSSFIWTCGYVEASNCPLKTLEFVF